MRIDGLPEGYDLVRIGAPKAGEDFIHNNGNVTHAFYDVFNGLHAVGSIFPIVRKLPEPLVKAGCWYERGDGKIVGPASDECNLGFKVGDFFYNADGTGGAIGPNERLIREVPPPKPAIDPGEGWRLLEEGEKVADGDELTDYGKKWWQTCNTSGDNQSRGFTYRRRIAPKFRPFANASEYRPHAVRWIKNKSDNQLHLRRVDGIRDTGVDWKNMFYTFDYLLANFTFEDGTPCGVKE